MAVVPSSAFFSGNPSITVNGYNGMSDYQFASEMGPVEDISTFPPTMATLPPSEGMEMFSMENFLSHGFWDSVLVPGEVVFTRVQRSLNGVSQVTRIPWRG